MGVESCHVGFGMTKQGLGNGVLGGGIRRRTQAVTKTVPTKTLTLGHQPQRHSGWLNEIGV
jgi:hypothetical protein